jgi:hypothetical protein
MFFSKRCGISSDIEAGLDALYDGGVSPRPTRSKSRILGWVGIGGSILSAIVYPLDQGTESLCVS